jgi:hypothetical protein
MRRDIPDLCSMHPPAAYPDHCICVRSSRPPIKIGTTDCCVAAYIWHIVYVHIVDKSELFSMSMSQSCVCRARTATPKPRYWIVKKWPLLIT